MDIVKTISGLIEDVYSGDIDSLDELQRQLIYLKSELEQLTLTDVSQRSEQLLCGVCDVETWHDTSNKKELNCLKCGNVAKE